MIHIVCPLGTPLYPSPARTAPIGYLLAWARVEGERVEGARVHDNPLWVRAEVYMWVERLMPRTTEGE